MQSIQGQEWSRCTEGKSVFAQDYTPVSSVNDRTETWVLGIHSVRRNVTPFLVIWFAFLEAEVRVTVYLLVA